MACLRASVCSPRCVYYSCPCEGAAEGAWVSYTEKIALPSAGSSRSAAATAAFALLLMSFPDHPSCLLPLRRNVSPPPPLTVCVREVPGLKGISSPIHSSSKALNWLGTLVKFEVAFFAPGVTWSKIKIHTQKHALILSDDKRSWG